MAEGILFLRNAGTKISSFSYGIVKSASLSVSCKGLSEDSMNPSLLAQFVAGLRAVDAAYAA